MKKVVQGLKLWFISNLVQLDVNVFTPCQLVGENYTWNHQVPCSLIITVIRFAHFVL